MNSNNKGNKSDSGKEKKINKMVVKEINKLKNNKKELA